MRVELSRSMLLATGYVPTRLVASSERLPWEDSAFPVANTVNMDDHGIKN